MLEEDGGVVGILDDQVLCLGAGKEVGIELLVRVEEALSHQKELVEGVVKEDWGAMVQCRGLVVPSMRWAYGFELLEVGVCGRTLPGGGVPVSSVDSFPEVDAPSLSYSMSTCNIHNCNLIHGLKNNSNK